jgi:glycosyltransferase involved in cell wall biosynthesis
VGRLIELKGLIPFLEALARWAAAHPERTIQFTLAGSGPMQPKIESFAMPQNVQVRLVGECDYSRLAELYNQAGIFVFPSLADDWGISVNEAMASGLPVLGSVYSQAVAEMCADGQTGWTFRTNVPEELDRAIAAALGTAPEKLDQMRQAARACVAWRTPARGTEDLLGAIRAAWDER